MTSSHSWWSPGTAIVITASTDACSAGSDTKRQIPVRQDSSSVDPR